MLEVNLEELLKLSDEEQAEIAALLDLIEQGAAVNPLLFFTPYPEQYEFLLAKDRFKWLLGGNRAGKTITCVVDDLIQAVDEDCLPEHLKSCKKWTPPFKWRIVAMDFDAIELIVMEEIQRWVPPKQLLGGSWKNAYSKERRVLRFANGSMCQFKTYEQPAFNHGGAALHRVHFDEEPPHGIYKENRIRVTDFDGDIICAMTPVQGITWMYDQFYIPWKKGLLQNSFVRTVDMDDNPYISVDAKNAALLEYTAEEREARKTGRFMAIHGLIYPQFSEDHIIPQTDPPKEAPVYVAIDPGMRHMAGVVFVYHTYDDELVVFDEIAAQGATAQEVANMIKMKNAQHDIKPAWYVMDPSGRNLMHNTGRSLQMEYSDHGISAFPGQNDVRAGLNHVKVRLDNKKLFVMQNCTHTIDEFRKYRWTKPPRMSENDAKEAPVKKDDHLLDALRYLVMARPYVQQTNANDPVDPMGVPLQGAALAAWKDRRKKYERNPQPAWTY